MILQRTGRGEQIAANRTQEQREARAAANSQRPLTCMFYFFASQMKHNIQPADQDLVRRGMVADKPTHRLDSMLARIGMYAAHSPLITKFETFPMEIGDQPVLSRPQPESLSREDVHDTVLLVKFKNKGARESWITTKEWQDFMEKTEGERVFRQMPHVRCASSARGLMDPIDMLTA
ncbi:hypothetical protein A1O1_04436 [Capronia coronata CBS 617.96]|uniref:Uncharacterized protein n=1 Tax=Capronia coronata CBS 617.96 TaxID=1182541 RepID=W9Z9X9_9EURO|nr:uncharacterized protein A1O1_04436 [Capronia coronata CBS 617.96]EXJ91324.1 hypothetical protein A1O1_04436 [Capronia coronata CBS 617.96]